MVPRDSVKGPERDIYQDTARENMHMYEFGFDRVFHNNQLQRYSSLIMSVYCHKQSRSEFKQDEQFGQLA